MCYLKTVERILMDTILFEVMKPGVEWNVLFVKT